MIENPFKTEDAAANTVPRPQPNPRPRILVVEDDAVMRELNRSALTECGYHVDIAEDGAAAWAALQLNSYDLMITDNGMPKVSGIDLLKKLHAAHMALPVIMATAHAEPGDAARFKRAGADGYVSKPIDRNLLYGEIVNLVTQRLKG